MYPRPDATSAGAGARRREGRRRGSGEIESAREEGRREARMEKEAGVASTGLVCSRCACGGGGEGGERRPAFACGENKAGAASSSRMRGRRAAAELLAREREEDGAWREGGSRSRGRRATAGLLARARNRAKTEEEEGGAQHMVVRSTQNTRQPQRRHRLWRRDSCHGTSSAT